MVWNVYTGTTVVEKRADIATDHVPDLLMLEEVQHEHMATTVHTHSDVNQ